MSTKPGLEGDLDRNYKVSSFLLPSVKTVNILFLNKCENHSLKEFEKICFCLYEAQYLANKYLVDVKSFELIIQRENAFYIFISPSNDSYNEIQNKTIYFKVGYYLLFS